MELSQLLYFNAVVRYHTVTSAAKKLNITQSAVSKSIAALEEELGTPLFQRSNRSMRLTPAGETMLVHVRNALNELDSAKREIAEQKTESKHDLQIRVETPEFMLGLLESYLQKSPQTRLVQSYEGSNAEEALLSGEINFCITSCPPVSGELEWLPLLTEPLFVMVREDHPLARRETVALAALAEEKFITLTSNPELERTASAFCRLAGFEPQIVCEAGETPDVQKLVEMGMGIAFCSSCIRLRRYQDEPDFREDALPFRYLTITAPPCVRTIGIVSVRGRYLTSADREFLDFVKEYFHALDVQIQTLLPHTGQRGY